MTVSIRLEVWKKLRGRNWCCAHALSRVCVAHYCHIEYTWRDGKWDSGIPVPVVSIPITSCVHYGQAVFDGLKACKDVMVSAISFPCVNCGYLLSITLINMVCLAGSLVSAQ